MKPLTRLDKISLAVALVAFVVTTILGLYVRIVVGGEGGRATASSIFGLGLVVILATALFRDLRKPKKGKQ